MSSVEGRFGRGRLGRGRPHLGRWLANTGRDLRYALRIWRRSPGSTAVALVTLALGVAANVTVFSFVDAIFLKPPAVADAERLVGVFGVGESGYSSIPFGYGEYAFLRTHAATLARAAAHYSTAPLYVGAAGEYGEVQGAVVSSGYFETLGLRPLRGRFFSPREDAVPDRDAVAVVSHAFWRSRLGSDPAAVGSTLRINGRIFQVVGIMPPGFRGVASGASPDEIWIPAMMVRTGYRWCDGLARDCHVFGLVGRLAAGRTPAEAEAELTALARRFEAGEAGDGGTPRRLAVRLLRGAQPAEQGAFADLARLLGAAAALVLVVACANLGGLLLAQGAARRGEIGLRLALGAGRPRLVGQLLAESLLLAVAGGGLGLLLSLWTSRLLMGFYAVDQEGYEHLYDVGLDWRVLGCALLVSLLAGVLFGLWPALRSARGELGRAARKASARVSRRVLPVAQVALSLALLVGAGLLAQSGARIEAGSRFDPRHVAVLRLRPRLVGYGPREAQAFQREVVRGLETLPGVESVSLADGQGLVWRAAGETRVQPAGKETAAPPGRPPGGRLGAPEQGLSAGYHEVAPRYFATLRIPLLQGRDFDPRDLPAAPAVAIVNETLARELWGPRSPLDQTLVLDSGTGGSGGSGVNGRSGGGGGERAVRVVGLVADARLRSALEPPAPMLYLPYWQDPEQIDSRLCVRVAGRPEAALPAIRRTISAVDPRVPVSEVMSMLEQVHGVYTPVRVAGAVLACGAGVALLLAALGLYGVLAYGVARRTPEIAVRMAVGARRAQVAALFVREGLSIALLGAALGLAGALAAAHLLAAWLYGVEPRDPLTFTAAAVLLTLVALLASYLPARRAASVDPMTALRSE
jgi:predicted permease